MLGFSNPSLVRSVEKFCDPLFKVKDINFFYFARVFDDGKCELLTHCPNALRYLFDRQMQVTAEIPKEVIKDAFWYMIPRNDQYLPPLMDYEKLFGVANLVDWIDRYTGYYEMYCFGTPYAQTDIASSVFLNRKNQLLAFAGEFKNEFDPILKNSEAVRLVLPQGMRPTIRGMLKKRNSSTHYSSHFLEPMIHQFNFTPREKECIYQLALGQTGKQIAEALGLSYRTVEFYLDNARSKLGLERRSEIIKTILAKPAL
jgi:DNA-binding CsgD family transcriptional regulator